MDLCTYLNEILGLFLPNITLVFLIYNRPKPSKITKFNVFCVGTPKKPLSVRSTPTQNGAFTNWNGILWQFRHKTHLLISPKSGPLYSLFPQMAFPKETSLSKNPQWTFPSTQMENREKYHSPKTHFPASPTPKIRNSGPWHSTKIHQFITRKTQTLVK